MAKKQIHNLRIDHLRYPDKGIAFLDSFGDKKEVTLRHGLPGQLVEARCGKRRRKWEGQILQVIEPAPEEVDKRKLPCPEFGICGGCSFLNIPYEYELKLKQNMAWELLENFSKEIHNSSVPSSIIAAPESSGYRNKMEFSFGDSSVDEGVSSTLALGIRQRGRFYEVTVPKNCVLIPESFKAICLATLEYFRRTDERFYHKMRRTGTLRYLVLRRGEFTGEVLVNLVTTNELDKSHLQKWATALQMLPFDIVGILHTTSDVLSDAVVPESVDILWGRDKFYEKLRVNGKSLTFGISPFSFFQTYSAGAELLYSTVAEFAGQTERIFDLYCGTGTIAQVLSSCANEVIGIELVPEAVEMAIENANANGIENCRFIAGDVLKILDELPQSPDVIILDPPRDGIHPKALPKLIAFGARKIVYVSCKPTSLARDLPIFIESGYNVSTLRFHDMFPRTPHIETVCLLERR